MRHYSTLAALFAIILFSLAFPFLIGDPSTTSMAVEVLLLTGAAVVWNIFSGYTGYISLGHATYYGLGAYTLALACQDWHISGGYGPFLLIPLAGLVAGAFSIPLGWIALRTRRYTFMVITIALFFIFQTLAFNLRGLTGGSEGIFLPLPDWSTDLYNIPFYYIALTLLLLATFVSWWIRHSRLGLELLAIRDDEDRTRGLGIRVGRHKLTAYVLSAAFIGMIGALSIYFGGLITPPVAFDQTLDITIVTMTFFGGVGSVLGPIVGGLLLEPLQTYLNQQFGSSASSINQILFGCILLVVIFLLPQGIVPSLYKLWQKRITTERHKRIATMQHRGSEAAEVVPYQPAGSLAFQRNRVLSVPLEQRPNQNAWLLPRRPSAQTIEEASTSSYSQKLRALRLEPLSSDEPLTATQEVAGASLTISWRCPTCKKPLLLSDDICYCARCGFTRSLSWRSRR